MNKNDALMRVRTLYLSPGDVIMKGEGKDFWGKQSDEMHTVMVSQVVLMFEGEEVDRIRVRFFEDSKVYVFRPDQYVLVT